MAKEKLEIIIELDDGSIKRGFATIEKESKKTGEKVERNLDSLKNLGKTAALAGAAFVAAFGVKAIQAATRQEDAINGLNNALRLAGDSVGDLSKNIQEYAAEIERTTKVSDELVLEQFAIARAFARSADEAKDLVSAAIDLSAATGIELSSAVRNLGKTFSGLQGEIGESVSDIRTLTQEQLKAGAALDVVKQKFGGAAQAQISTFGGAVTQTANAFGTLIENIGLLLIRQPAVTNAIINLTKNISGLADGLQKAFPKLFTSELERVKTRLSELKDEQARLKTEIDKGKESNSSWLGTLSKAGGFVGAVAGSVNILSGEYKTNSLRLKDVNDEIDRLTQREKFLNVEKAAGDFNLLSQQLKDLQLKYSEAFNVSKTNEQFDVANKTLLDSLSAGLITQQEFNSLSFGLEQDRLLKIAELQKYFAEQQNLKLKEAQEIQKSTLFQGATASVAAFGKALATGGDPAKAFFNSILNTIGDFAIQYGTFSVAIGIVGTQLAAALSNPYTAPASIPLGIALIALGAGLKALGSSVETGGFAAAGGSGNVPQTDFSTISQEDIADQVNEIKPTEVNIDVTGQVVDPRGTALQIAELLRDVRDTNGEALVVA